MSVRMIFLVTLVFAPLAAANAGASTIAGVITLLGELKVQSEGEGKKEAANYAEYTHWCKTERSDLQDKVTEFSLLISQLESKKAALSQLASKLDGDASATAEIKALTNKTSDDPYHLSASEAEVKYKLVQGQIKNLGDEISALNLAQKSSNTKKKKLDAAFDDGTGKAGAGKKQVLESTIAAVDSAIAGLQTAVKDSLEDDTGKASEINEKMSLAQQSVTQALAFLSMETTEEQNVMLVDFANTDFATPPTLKAQGDAASHVKKYSSKSGSVIELLKKMKIKCAKDLVEATAENTRADNAHKLATAARDSEIAAFETSKQQKEGTSADTAKSLSAVNSDLKEATDNKKTASDTLAMTNTQCRTRAAEWKERVSLRANEIQALSMGAEILAKVSGVVQKKPDGIKFEKASKAPSFLQVVDPVTRAMNLLRATAKTTKSQDLMHLAAQISAHNPSHFNHLFDTVQKVILKSDSDQLRDLNQKTRCVGGLLKTQKTITEQKEKYEAHDIALEALKAEVGKIQITIQEDNEQVRAAEHNIMVATQVRNANKQDNKEALRDSDHAQKAIDRAIAVLQEMHDSVGESTASGANSAAEEAPSLKGEPSTWGSAFSSGSGANGAGVVAILKEVGANFAHMAAETKAQDVDEQQQFTAQIAAFKLEIAQGNDHAKLGDNSVKRKLEEMKSTDSQKKTAKEAMSAAEKYKTTLDETCKDVLDNYAKRTADRKTEETNLKGAVTILRGAMKEKKVEKKSAVSPGEAPFIIVCKQGC